MPKRYEDEDLLAALKEAGTKAGAARLLGMDERGLKRRLKALEAQEAREGYAPAYGMTHRAPPGFGVKGTTTLYDEEGNKRLQWVRVSRDEERQAQMMREAIEAFADDIPRETLSRAPTHTQADLANCYVITDFHLGMMAWQGETGANWDTRIAEDLLVSWFAAAIKCAPDAHTGIFAQLGDFMHWDGMDAVTPASKHLLDADTRFQKLVRVAIRAMRRIIGMLLEKHQHVHILMAEGNHDPASSIWLREWFAALYEDEPRISVDRSADPYYCFEWGKTSVFFHHGHKRKPEAVDDVFVSKFREVFGRTKHSYAHMGHMHHRFVKETSLMEVEQHRTLAAPDAYASRGGWMSGRDAKVITYSREFGRVGEITLSPDMVKAA